ncbi:hydantoinase/oxoprolinase family protein [Sulfitobacter aestuariivivens]|uniref:Hydantoinase/oxoprolinase family protein n=1 Tax=Sulfitobacter aestuariivivens TaxID=2766981 RepID=A0A927HFJ3_9RHOB|nr:hydantoinase/oxoprolinase family protein [Sulfitobacter aestuariivivens]MBD3664493.1 hydantoinase/oxoprolinase family protein [Sulfitobacter aestuariivivens]
MQHASGHRLAIDIGGTFTDTVLVDAQGAVLATSKTPTTPAKPARGALEGATRVLAETGCGWSQIGGFIHGTTLATNALIERRGAVVATITTAGFRDILQIGYERRYSQYDINLVKPDLLVPRSRAFTIAGRMTSDGVERAHLDEAAVAALVDGLVGCGAQAVAICLMHSYANPAHEIRLGEMLREALPDLVISLSHDVSPEAREFDRLSTTIANAYIQPLMAQYLTDFQTRFSENGLTCPILMMTAGGGMTTIDIAARLPIRLVESGPAGGAILAARIAAEVDESEVLSFDMGGTTAKLCLIDGFRPQTTRKFEIARAERFIKGSGMPVRIPVIEMIEIGAGGGSIAHVDRLGRVQVGPESAGSEPGPAAFAKGGTAPTVTDADVMQGLIDPGLFAEGRLEIDVKAAEAALIRDIGAPLDLDAAQAAQGISEIVDENMAGAGRMHAVESGKDLGARLMIAFGGNGPLHATRVARRAQVERILIPRDPGVGSAVGFLFAPVSFEIVRSRYSTLDALDLDGLNTFFQGMIDEALQVVQGAAPDARLVKRRVAFMRYHGQGHEIEIPLPDDELAAADMPALRAAFEEEYSRQFRRAVPGMTIEVLNWAVTVSTEQAALSRHDEPGQTQRAMATGHRRVLCDVDGDWRDAEIYMRAALRPGDHLAGPSLIIEPQTTTFVSSDFSARVDGGGNIWLQRERENRDG